LTPKSHLPSKVFSVFTDPCHFSEDQFSTNVDYIARPNNKIAARFFAADEGEIVTISRQWP